MNRLFKIISGLFIALLIAAIGNDLETQAAENSENKIVKVGYYANEKFQEGASEGAIKSGYSYEYLQKIASLTGWKYEYVYGSWNDIYEAFVNGDIDLLAGLGYSESRLDIMNYPDYPMGFESYYLFVSSSDDTITMDTATLNGKKIGSISGLMVTAMQEWLDDRNIKAEIVVFDDVPDRDEALEKGEIDAFIGESTSVSAKSLNKPLLKIKSVNMYVCVAKQRTDILRELNIALSELDSDEPYYIDEISEKYFSNSAININLSHDETDWLKRHGYTIRIGYMDDFLPYCGTDADGNAIGIMVDVLNNGFSGLKLEQDVNFEYVVYDSTDEMIDALHNHEIDLLFPVSNNIYYLEQHDLFHSKDVIITAMNMVYSDNIETALEKPIAVNRNNQIQYDYVHTNFPDSRVIYYETVDECLKAVNSGEAGGAILSGLRVSTLLKHAEYSDLKYVELPVDTVKCFGVSNLHRGILPLINRAIGTLTNNDSLTYTYKYIDDTDDYSIREFLKRNMYAVAAVILLIIAAFIAVIAITVVKHQKQKLYFEYAFLDSLTGLLNRRSYEEEIERVEKNIPDNIVCVSMDLNGLKKVNDNLGHSAGDELIREAGRLIKSTFGKYGKVFRTGGDEYYGILRADMSECEIAQKELDELCEDWEGEFSSDMKISVGFACKEDAGEDGDLMSIIKVADKRMYEAKSAFYRANNIDRRRG